MQTDARPIFQLLHRFPENHREKLNQRGEDRYGWLDREVDWFPWIFPHMPHGEFLKDSSSWWDSEAAWVLGQLPVLTTLLKLNIDPWGHLKNYWLEDDKLISCPCFFGGATRPSFRGWMLVLNGPFRHLSRNGKIETNWQGTQKQFLETEKTTQDGMLPLHLAAQTGSGELRSYLLVGKGGAVQGDVLTVEQTNNL